MINQTLCNRLAQKSCFKYNWDDPFTFARNSLEAAKKVGILIIKVME